MLTLHNVVEKSKLTLKIAMLLTIVLTIIIVLIRTGIYLKEQLFPTPPPPPTIAFGKLPKLIFPKSVNSQKLSFTIDTITGTLPALPDRTSVFPAILREHNLLALQRASERVKSLGFSGNKQQVSDRLYLWEKPGKTEILTYDILSLNFKYSIDEETKQQLYRKSNIRDKGNAIAKAQSFISLLSNFPADIDPNKTTVQNLTYANDKLETPTSIGNTRILRVDFFQKDIENLPIFYPHPPASIMHVIIGGENTNPIVVESTFYYLDLQTNSATYPIKTAQEAFQNLQNNQAYIASYYGADKEVAIKNVFLAYYVGDIPQQFLMPVIVFEGKEGFYAYVSAVRNEWIK